MRSAADKFREDLEKRVRWWRVEFDLDHHTTAGVLMCLLMDVLMYDESVEIEDDDEEDEDEDE